MTRRDRNVLLVVAAVALIVGFWFVVLAPTRKESSDLDNKIAKQEQRLATAQAKLATAQKAKSGYAADYAAVARLGQAVPADDDVASLVYQVDKAAGRKINFSSIKLKTGGGAAPSGDPAAAGAALPPGAAVGSAGFPTMPFTFSFAGGFNDVQRLLERFNRLTTVSDDRIDVRGRLLTVDRVTLGAAADGFPALTMEVDATAYLVPKDEGLTDGATPAGPANSTTVNDKPPAGGVPTSAALTTGASR
jgi:hypothetical protein